MAKTAKITLDGREHEVHAFSIRELRQVAGIIQKDGMDSFDRSIAILSIALRRADPPVDDIESMEASFDEITAAGLALMELAGLKVTANPPQAGETASAA